MRSRLLLLLLTLLAAPAQAQSDVPRATIVAMAQHFVQDRLMQGGSRHARIAFDVAHLHPQPQPRFWAVVGGFVSGQTSYNSYVAALRLTCPDADAIDCWQLEKLAINNEILLDRGDPL